MKDGQLALKDVDGCLCVAGASSESANPIIHIVHWPTPHKTIDLLSRLDVKSLDELTIERSIPGEYKVSAKGAFGARVHIQLVDGGKTKPIKVISEPIPAPKRAQKAEYRDGQWHKLTARGWQRA